MSFSKFQCINDIMKPRKYELEKILTFALKILKGILFGHVIIYGFKHFMFLMLWIYNHPTSNRTIKCMIQII